MFKVFGHALWLILFALAGILGLSATDTTAQQASNSIAQSGLVGKLEGATIVTDPAAWPKTFQEAPPRYPEKGGSIARRQPTRRKQLHHRVLFELGEKCFCLELVVKQLIRNVPLESQRS